MCCVTFGEALSFSGPLFFSSIEWDYWYGFQIMSHRTKSLGGLKKKAYEVRFEHSGHRFWRTCLDPFFGF